MDPVKKKYTCFRMKQSNHKYIIFFVLFFTFSCRDKEKEQELQNHITTAENMYKNTKEKYDSLVIDYNKLSENSNIERKRLEAELSELNNRLSSQEEQLNLLRSQNIEEGQEGYVNSLVGERDRLASLLKQSEEKNATLAGTIANLEIQFNEKSKKYVEAVSNTLIQVYEDLLDITEQKSLVAKDLKRYNQGVKEINIASSIKTSLNIIRERLNNTKAFVENVKQNPDSLSSSVIEQFTKVSDRVATVDSDIIELESTIARMSEELNEANKAYLLIRTKDELKEIDVLERRGMLGFGKLQLNLKNLDLNQCTIVDKRGDLLVIPHLENQIPSILTSHPKFSFSLRNESSTVSILTIRNPKSFWSLASSLVISLD